MKPWLFAAVCGAVFLQGALPALGNGPTIRVLTFNAWGGGANDGSGPSATIAVLRASRADLMAVQEVQAERSPCDAQDCPPAGQSFAPAAAEALGYIFVEFSGVTPLEWSSATFGRYPVIATSPRRVGTLFDVKGRRVALFNIHLTDFPYQPYQAAGIPYGDAPLLTGADELIEAAEGARGDALDMLRSELTFAEGADLTIIAGDFNEPSHRDWTEAAAAAGRHPLAVEYPTVMALEALGFVDAYRAVHPDEMANPGFTWTPTARPDNPAEHHDRIDFILVRGEQMRVSGAWVIGESPRNADIVVLPWPSDHRGVIAEIELLGDNGSKRSGSANDQFRPDGG